MPYCVVCEAEVDPPKDKPLVFANEERMEQIGHKESVLIVCNEPRCIRLVMEAAVDDGFKLTREVPPER